MLNQALLEAVKSRQTGVVSAILKRVETVNFADGEGLTPLMIAARDGTLPIVKLLLAHGADCFSADRQGRTPLHWAALFGHSLVVDALAQAGADVNAQDRDGRTALMTAIAARRGEAALRLVRREETDAALTDQEGRTALDFAAGCGMPDLLAALSELAQNRSSGWLGKFDASRGKDAGRLTKDRSGSTALHHAARQGDEEALALLLQTAEGDVNGRNDAGETPLLAAVRAGAVGCVRRLLAVEADPDKAAVNGETPLLEAARLGRLVIAEALLDAGADAGKAARNGMTPLLTAIRERQPELVRTLLERGASVDVRDAQGRGPLAYASASGLEAITVMLVEAGAQN